MKAANYIGPRDFSVMAKPSFFVTHGLPLEVFAAMRVATQSSIVALMLSIFTLLLYVIFWFALPIFLRDNIG